MEFICPGCGFIAKSNSYENIDSRKIEKEVKSIMTTHKKNCEKFLVLDDIPSIYHQWCIELSEDRYDIWLVDKKKQQFYIYTVNDMEGNKKYPFSISLEILKKNIQMGSKADPIFENEKMIIYVKYVNVLTRKDKTDLRNSLLQFVARTIN